jgi:regulator of protease activity HflC (stomatin/prohibitin superfamily)
VNINMLNMEDKHLINPVAIIVFVILAGLSAMLYYLDILHMNVMIAGILLAMVISMSVKIANHWEKAIVLRMGKFKGLKGPGVFLIIPIIDRIYKYIDHRVRVTDFKAEQALTKDTVPVNVDAVVYWMVWDAEKAALEVQKFRVAVSYISQTSLRDIIGKHELADLLQNREKIGAALQETMDEFTNPWGITCQAVGIKDIVIPANLSNAMSKQAQAERERLSRIILGTAETEIAENFAKASEQYIDNPVALQLRGMNMLYEGLKEKGSLVVVPSSALESMNMGAIGGLGALSAHKEKERQLETEQKKDQEAKKSKNKKSTTK